VSARCGELIATDEPAIFAKPPFNSIVVENGENDGRFADSTNTDQSYRQEAFCKTNDLLDQRVASKERPWWWRRRIPLYAR